jgi:hypothetical protein
MPRVVPLVFVSSTFKDLVDYRKAVMSGFPALDVLYRGMEFFGARPERARHVITNEVLECDLYVGILAHRYGERETESGLSYTEFEYRLARQNGIPTLCFLIDPDYPVVAATIEEEPKAKSDLASFKQSVCRETVVEWFTTPEDLVARVGHSLAHWLIDKRDVWQHLLHIPVTERENENIGKLYSADLREALHAVNRLNSVDCRAAYEHFYALLHRPDLPVYFAEAVFQQLKFAVDDQRIGQMLMNIIDEVPRFRSLAIGTIGERATIRGRVVSSREFDTVLRYAQDSEHEVRFEVAHALGKLGSRFVDWEQASREALARLQADPVARVSEKAGLALERMPVRRRSTDA